MKIKGIDFGSSEGKTAKTNVNWKKIIGTASGGAKNIFEPIMPTTIGTINNATGFLRDYRNATIQNNRLARREKSRNANSTETKRSMALFKSAMDDLGSGNYSIEKINNDLYDGYETETADSFVMPSGDDAVDMSSEEILLIGNKGVAQSVIQGTSAQLRAIQESTGTIVRSNSKTAQALSLSINNSITRGFTSLNTTLIIQNQKIDALNSTMQSILAFNNTNALQYYTKSIDMLAGLGTMMENLDKTLNPQVRKRNRRLDLSSGFSIKNYIDYVKEGFKESSLANATNLIGDANKNGKDFGLFGILANLLVPKSIKNPLEKFDKSFNRLINEGLSRLGEKLEKNEWLQLFGIDGSVFGNKRETINKVNLGKYIKGATPWNGMAQKALTEVIPELLTSIDSKLDNSEKRYYDYDTGQFKNRSKIEKEFNDRYFDAFSTSLVEAMDKLNKAAANSGRTKQDQEQLKNEIQSMIDDQILNGNKDVMKTRNRMSSKMSEYGVDKNDIRDFIMEFQEGLENAISSVNDLFEDVSSRTSVYRNLYNTHGKTNAKTIKNMHASHSRRYDQFSFLGGNSYEKYIERLQRTAGISSDIDLKNNEDLRMTILGLMSVHAPEEDIAKAIESAIYVEKLKDINTESNSKSINKLKSVARMIKKKTDKATTKIGKNIEKVSNRATQYGFDKIYMGNSSQQESQNTSNVIIQPAIQNARNTIKNTVDKSKKVVRGKASTYLTKNQNNVTAEETRSLEQIEKINNKSFDKYNEQTQVENNDDERVMEKSLTTLNDANPVKTLEGSLIQSNNMLKAGLGAIALSFKGFTSRLFGKEGFFRKIWDSDTRKKITNYLKEVLFTGDDAVFKDQYEAAKTGLKNIKDKTFEYLGKGYDFLYDNTMQYLYGKDENGNIIDYRESEKYKNNTFVSQTLNRRWRAEQKRKKQEEKEKAETLNALEQSDKEENIKDDKDNIKNEDVKPKLLLTDSQSKAIIPKEINKTVALPAPKQTRAPLLLANPDSKISSDKTDNKLVLPAIIPDSKKTSSEVTNKVSLPAVIPNTTENLNNALVTMTTDVVSAGENLKESVDTATEVLVGDPKVSPEKKKESFFQKFKSDFKATAPKALAGAIGGSMLGALNSSFSLLGSMFLPGGPIAGAIVGGGLSILSQTEAFKTFMFGKMDENTKKREGGLINEQMRAKFKQMMPFAIGGAVIGGLKGLLKGALGFHGGLGILGMQILPGGILGGALLGAGLGILKQSDTFKDLLYGKKDENGNRTGSAISNSFKKMKDAFGGIVPGLKKAGKGLAVGALTGSVLAHAGYIPAMLSMGGPVGMGIVGLGVGIASSTKHFNEWMFGSEELDENGNPTGKRNKDGILNRVKNILKVNIVEPISIAFKTKMLDLVDWTKEKITYPFRLAFGPIIDSLKGIKDNVVDFVKDKFEAIGNGIKQMISSTLKTLFSPITKLIGGIGKGIIGAAGLGAKTVIGLAGMPLQGLAFLTAGKRRKEYADFYKNYYSKGNIKDALHTKWDIEARNGKKRGFFGKLSDTVGTYLGQGEIADAARAGWNAQMSAEGKNTFNWRNVYQERREMRANRAKRLQDERSWRKIDKYRQKIINDDLNGREFQLNDYQFKKYKDKFEKLGISSDLLQSSDDIMDLLYRRSEFKSKLNPGKNGTKGLVVEETPEQKAAREQTEKFQEETTMFLKGISEHFGILAEDLIREKKIETATKDWKVDKKNLRKRLDEFGMKDIDINNPEMQDYDINELDEDMLNKFRYSKFYKSGDLLGFMKLFNVTQKSAFKNDEETIIPNIKPKANETEVISEEEARNGVLLNDLVETNKQLLAVTTQNRDIMSAQTEISTGGKLNTKEITKRKGRSLGKSIANKFNILTGWFNYNKKKDKEAAEASESKYARDYDRSEEENDTNEIVINGSNAQPEKKKSIFGVLKDGASKLFGKVGGIFGTIGSTKIGGMLLGGAKTLGLIGLISAVGIAIMEMVKPGTENRLLNQSKELTDAINSGNLYEDFVKPKLSNGIDMITNALSTGTNWISDNFPTIFQDTILPRLQDGATMVANNAEQVVGIASSLIDAFAPAFATAAGEVVPTIMGSFIKASFNATMRKMVGWSPFGKNSADEQKITDSSIPDINDKEALVNSINNGGKASYTDAKTGETVNISAESAEIDDKTGAVKINYADKHEKNHRLLYDFGRGFVNVAMHPGKGLATKIAKAGVKLPFQTIGGMTGGTTGLTIGTLLRHPIIGTTKGVQAGTKLGGKVGDAIANSAEFTGKALWRSNLADFFSGRIGEGGILSKIPGIGKSISKNIELKDINIDPTVLKETIDKTVKDKFSKTLTSTAGEASESILKNITKDATEEASEKIFSNAATEAIAKSLAENRQVANSSDDIAKAVTNLKNKFMKKSGTESISDFVENVAKATSTADAGALDDVAKSQKSMLVKIFDKIKESVKKLDKDETLKNTVSRFSKEKGLLKKFADGLTSFLDMISKVVYSDKNLITKLFVKISEALGSIGLSVSPAVLAMLTYDLINGAYAAENLFMVPPGEADWLMRTISALLEATNNIPVVGAPINIAIDVVSAFMNKNYKCILASSLYKAMAPDDGGFGLKGDQKLEDNQLKMEIATLKYNYAYGSNITTKEYNDKVNKGIGGSIWSGIKSGINKIAGYDRYETKYNVRQTVSDEELAAYKAGTFDVTKSTINKRSTVPNTDYTATMDTYYGLGYGKGFSQGDSRWASMPIGTFENGNIATMKQAGCGPTALASVVDTIKSRSVGYGELTPRDVAIYASANGYISNGGANAGLFTEGAHQLGLNSTLVTNKAQLRDNLLAGRPTVLTGKSANSSDPYTGAGHIVVADGIEGDQINVMDPITGRHKLYDMDSTAKMTDNAWAYSPMGYGKKNTPIQQTFVSATKATKNKWSWFGSNVAKTKWNWFDNNGNINYKGKSSTKKSIKTTNVSSLKNKTSNYKNKFSISGLIDSATINGYHTEESGVDVTLMNANYEYFNANDNYYHDKYREAVKSLDKNFTLSGRTGASITNKKLAFILSTQYFGTEGNTYGTITIKARQGTSINSLTSDEVAHIFAAAILAENAKSSGGLNINAPLSKAEKFIAFANACRIMYGLAETMKFLTNQSNYDNLVNSVSDDSYSQLTSLTKSVGEDVIDAVTSADGGITNASQLKALAAGKKGFGKLLIIGKIAQAKINSILNGTDFWTEINKLFASESSTNNSDNTGSFVLTNASASLKKAIENPDNIQEELLGKTIENIYRNETGGNYAAVIEDTGGTTSVGPYQANSGNAVTLLRQLQSTQGMPTNLKNVFSKYANMISQGKTLSESERNELSKAIGDESNRDIITKSIDSLAMKYYNDQYYRPHFAGYYDDGTIKDLRTFPMLADIGNTSPGNIYSTNKPKSFINHWTPTTKDKDFESAYNTLKKPGTFWKDHKFSKGYMKRIDSTYSNLKDYKFKREVKQGELTPYFAEGTNPLGFGPLNDLTTIGNAISDKMGTNNNEKVKAVTSSINSISDVLANHLSSKLGINISELGISGSNTTTNNGGGGVTNDYGYDGSYSLEGEQLTSLTGTDRDRFIAAAKSQVGYLEKANANNLKSFRANPGHNDYNKYAKEIGKTSSATWCNFFTSWAGRAAGIPDSIMPKYGKCSTTMNWYQKAGLYKPASSYSGQPGDLVFFDWNHTGKVGHIGVVTGSSGDNVYTIEGNTTMKGSNLEGAEAKTRRLSSGTIVGFATPNWTNNVGTVDPSKLLQLGYGKGSHTKIDNIGKIEQMRKTFDAEAKDEDFKVDLKELGFGPGMQVDAGFDMTNTDSKLDKIFGLIAEWFAEEKNNKNAAKSAYTNNINMIDASRTTAVTASPSATTESQAVNAQKHRANLVAQHILLSQKKNIRQTI